jgi:hypothetical protein
MKTSVILIIFILFNTTALIAAPLAQFVKEINTWLLVGIEAVLLIAFYCNKILRDLNNIEIDLTNLKL